MKEIALVFPGTQEIVEELNRKHQRVKELIKKREELKKELEESKPLFTQEETDWLFKAVGGFVEPTEITKVGNTTITSYYFPEPAKYTEAEVAEKVKEVINKKIDISPVRAGVSRKEADSFLQRKFPSSKLREETLETEEEKAEHRSELARLKQKMEKKEAKFKKAKTEFLNCKFTNE